jgi:hypothetical protein
MRQRTMLIRRVVGFAAALLSVVGESAHAQEPAGAPQGFINEPGIIERAAIFADRRHGNGEFTNGFYPDVWNMIPGAGWISGGPGYRHWYAKDRVFVDASAAVSWREYKTAQAWFELPKIASSRLAFGSQLGWQDFTQVSFFGEGPETLQTNRSEYRIRSQNLVGYMTARPVEWAGIGAEIGWLRPSILPRAGWFEGDRPDTRDVFPANPVFATADQPTFLHREVSLTADTRDFPRHPTRGGLYRAAAASYTDSDDVFSFRQYEAEGAHFVPLADSHIVIALHGWLVASNTSDGQVVPFYLQPSLGGHNTLRAYPDYRFHDRNLVLINAEGRVAMMAHVDAAVFFDAGNVAPRLGDLNLDKRSYGAGLRLHTRRHTFARLDIARGGEGWRLLFRVTDPLDLSRLSRRIVAAPFVP